jgi:hypothetical protein
MSVSTTGKEIDPGGVEHPAHYNQHPSGVECIDIIKHHNLCVGTAIKYLWRQGLKDGEPSEKDLRKAIEYIQFEIDRLEGFPKHAEPESWDRFEDIPLGMMFHPKSMPGLILEKLPKDLYAVKVRPNAYADIAIVVADHAPFVRADS